MLNKPPCVGFGTYLVDDPQNIRDAVRIGYRHFDCAFRYGNERMIGDVFKEIFSDSSYSVKREDLWITSKLWSNFHEPHMVEYQIGKTLEDLQLQYLDLFLIHWPLAIKHVSDRNYASLDDKNVTMLGTTTIRKTWEAMEKCVEKKQTRFIGVSNMGAAMLLDLLSYCKIKPLVNQFESQPYFPNSNLIDFCRHNDIHVTVYRPFGGRPREEMKMPLDDPVLKSISKEVHASVGEVILAWHWTRWGTEGMHSVIPKSSSAERQRQNLESIKLRLTPEQMKKIDALAQLNQRTCFTSYPSVPLFN